MGSVISSGVGSGLDVDGIVQKLVAAEGSAKSLRLNTAEAKVQAKLSAIGSLRSALASFRDSLDALKSIQRFQGRSATLSSKDFLSATAASTAKPSGYSIEVQALAAAHKLSKDFAAGTTVIGTGTLRITTAGNNFDIEIGAEQNTVAGIAAAINDSPASEHVVAGVVTGEGGAVRLVISARATGVANALTITQSGGDGGLAAIVSPPEAGGLEVLQAAQDARVLIDGFAVTSSTNTVSGAIEGVDLTLVKQNQPGETTQLTVGYDRDGARKAIDNFVKSYNALVDAVKSVSSYDPETKQGGPLFGDAGVRNLVYQLRRELSASFQGASGSFDTVGKLGISADLDGKLSVNASTLDAAFAADFDGVGELFAATDTGVAAKLGSLLNPYLESGGVFDARTESLKTSIKEIGNQRTALGQRLEALQARYLKQFNALDGLLAQLQTTSTFLSQQLSQLPGFGQLNGK